MNLVWKDFPPTISTQPYSSSNSSTRAELEEIAKKAEEAQEVSFIEGTQNLMQFIGEWKEVGFWKALYGKSFVQVLGDTMKSIGHEVAVFVLRNGDLFFLFPALLITVATFLVGKNKHTKWIIPLAFLYFVSRMFHWMLQ